MLIYLLPYRDFPLILREPVSVRLFDVAVLIFAVITFIVYSMRRRSFTIIRKPFYIFIVFSIWLLFASLIGFHNEGSYSVIIRYLCLAAYSFSIYILAANAAFKTNITWFIRHLVISLLIANVISFILMLSFPGIEASWGGGIYLENKGFLVRRFIGFASEPNYWGNLFLFLLPVAIAGIFEISVRTHLRLHPFFWFVLLGFAGLTFSTFTHLMVFLSFIGALFVIPGYMKKMLLSFFLVFVGLIGAIASHEYLGYLLTKLTTLETSSSFERFYWSYAAYNMWTESPFIGHGLGTYISNFHDFVSVKLPEAEQANSVFLATLSEQGIIGLSILIVMMLVASRLTSCQMRQAINSSILLKGLLLGLLLYFPYFFITGNLYLYYYWFYLGAFLGFAQREAHQRLSA